MSSVLAFCIAYAVLPFVNTLFNTRVSLYPLADPSLILFMTALAICVTLLSGSYPELILSGFKPVAALKGKLSAQVKGNFNLRRGLITAQFTIAQVLLIGLIVILHQLDYFKQTDMGFNQEAIVMIPLGSNDAKTKTLKDQFLQIPNVINVTQCFAAPASNNRWGTSLRFDNRSEDENFSASFKGADEDFISTFDINLVAGRNLLPSDTVGNFSSMKYWLENLASHRLKKFWVKLFQCGVENGKVPSLVSCVIFMTCLSSLPSARPFFPDHRWVTIMNTP